MTTLLIGCEVIRNEIEAAMARTGRAYPTVYLDGGLHMQPKRLKEALTQELDRLPAEVDTVLLGMALCGNAVVGFVPPVRLVVPKMDDCLTMFLHQNDEQHLNLKEYGEYYITEGWITVKNFIKEEYDCAMEKYGPKKGRRIMDRIFADYQYITMIDNGTYDPDDEGILAQAQETAMMAGCQLKRVAGTNLVLEKLLCGQWDQQFLVVPAGQPLELEDFMTASAVTAVAE